MNEDTDDLIDSLQSGREALAEMCEALERGDFLEVAMGLTELCSIVAMAACSATALAASTAPSDN